MDSYFTGSRRNCVTIDQFGIDPLRDKSLSAIASITGYNNYTVRQFERGRPDSISFSVYGNSNLWWIIMYYNHIFDFKNVREGVVLKIPELASVIDILSGLSSKTYENKVRTIVI